MCVEVQENVQQRSMTYWYVWKCKMCKRTYHVVEADKNVILHPHTPQTQNINTGIAFYWL